MANFKIPESPVFTEEIRKFETTDEGHADLFNDVVGPLVNNDVYLKKKLQDGTLPITGGTMRGDINMNGNHIVYGEKEIDFSGEAFEIGVREAEGRKIWSSYVNFDGNSIHAQAASTIKLVSFGSTLQLSEDIGLHNKRNAGIYTHGSNLGLNTPVDMDAVAGGHINFDANEEINIRSATEDINLESGDDIRINAEKDLELCSVGNKIWMYTAEDIRLLPGAASRSDAPSPEKYVKAGNIQGVKTSGGEKPSISNFKEVRAEELYEDGEKLSDRYLSLSGGKLNGDVSIPIERSSKDGSIPVAGSTMENLETLTDLKNYKTYLGAVQYKNVWNNIISIRHRNGVQDGVNYGMYIRSPLTLGGKLIYNKQTSANVWQGERTLIDSDGGDVSGELLLRKGFNINNVRPYNSSNGYLKFAELTVLSTYANSPVVFEIIKRGSIQPVILSVAFSGVNNSDPPLAAIRYYGSNHHIYIVKTETSKWNLYIECSAYDNICVADVKFAYAYNAIEISWKGEFVNSLPEGAQEATYALEASNADTVDGMHAAEFLPKSGGTMDDGAKIKFPSKTGGIEISGEEIFVDGVDKYSERVYAKLKSTELCITDTITDSNTHFYEDGIERDWDNLSFICNRDEKKIGIDVGNLESDGTRYGVLKPHLPTGHFADIGTSSNKWRNIYAANGVIQTSDRTKKTDVEELDSEKIKDFILGLITCSYKMVDGTSGRTHYGLIAQDIEDLMTELGIDSKDFAGFIKSQKKIIKDTDENGNPLKNPIEEIVEGEYDYALRYDEFIAPIIKFVQYLWEKIASQEKEMDEQKKEMENLKTRMKKLEEAVINLQKI